MAGQSKAARWSYLLARLLFGIWFLGAGLEYFLTPGLQPTGVQPLSQSFIAALIHSGLFTWVKLIEVAVGALVIANRGVLPALFAALPISAVVFYWNGFLEGTVVNWGFAVATLGINLALLLPYRTRLMPLLLWRS